MKNEEVGGTFVPPFTHTRFDEWVFCFINKTLDNYL